MSSPAGAKHRELVGRPVPATSPDASQDIELAQALNVAFVSAGLLSCLS